MGAATGFANAGRLDREEIPVINRTGRALFFFDLHTDTAIDPRDLGVAREDFIYPPVRAGEHIARRNRKSFAQFKA